MKNIFTIIFVFPSLLVFGQVQLSPVVIGSSGGHFSTGNLMISSTVGEAVIPTWSASGFVLTQGFHQPSASAVLGSLIIADSVKNARCLTASNGEISIRVLNGTPPYTFSWQPNIGNSPTITDLPPGTYHLLVTDLMGREGRDTIIVGAEMDDACEIHVYGGITPNGDGINDDWIIDGITLFPDNMVTIFNRWGEKVWQTQGYNNNDKLWSGRHMNGNLLPSGTYFYIMEIQGLDTQKGWVQITR